ncbi:hypothetical protein ACH35V_29770 [Actinomadura sp. 1N219]|uniref:AMP-binding enzyme n=1 Tax=Actinomadura sp. 1N219 TaxID=3375152 RepID=UPI0037913EB7
MPGVRDATVLAVPATGAGAATGAAADAEPELAAAVTGERSSAEQLFTALSERLPAYMLPRRITVLDRLPLTPRGKIDRRSLLSALAGTAAGPR